MNRLKLVLFISCLSLVLLAIPSATEASQWDHKTTVTFDQPVEIPGVGTQVLPAGTYIFKLMDSATNRHIVQILNQDQNHVYATILAIPNYRVRSTDKTVITFRERVAGSPEALRAWFYPGNNWGQEFVYPKARAIELAKITHEPVLAMPAELAPHIVAPVWTATEAPVVALMRAPVTAVRPTGEEVALAEVVEAPPVQSAAARPSALPRTAGLLPLFGLIGLLSLGAGLALSAIRKRSS
jgi:hypothetical protein